MGFGVASLPPEPVVLKKVTARSWAAEQELRSGDVLLEVRPGRTRLGLWTVMVCCGQVCEESMMRLEQNMSLILCMFLVGMFPGMLK